MATDSTKADRNITIEEGLTINVKDIKNRIAVAKLRHEKVFLPLYDKSKRIFKGEQWPDMKVAIAEDRPVVNYTRNAIYTRVSSTINEYPVIEVRPLNEAAIDWCKIAEQALNYYWRHIEAQAEIIASRWDSEIAGRGVVFVGWDWESVDVKMENARLRIEGEEEDLQDEEDVYVETDEEVPEEDVYKNQPIVRRLPPESFITDIDCGRDIQKAKYIVLTQRRPLAEIKNDLSLNGNRKKLKGTTTYTKNFFTEDMKKWQDGSEPTDMKEAQVDYYYEKSRRITVVISEGYVLCAKKWNWKHQWYPFAMFCLPDLPDECYPMPSPILVEHQQKEMNLCRKALAEYLRLGVVRFTAEPGLTPKQKADFKTAKTNSVIDLEDNQRITPLIPPPIPEAIFTSFNAALQDMQTQLDISSYDTQTPPTKRVTTTEAELIAMGGTGSRAAALRADFEVYVEKVLQQMLAWIMQCSDSTREIAIYDSSDQEALPQFHKFKGKDIRGQFKCTVTFRPSVPPTSADDAQAIAQLMQSAPAVAQSIPIFDAVGLNFRPVLVQAIQAIRGLRNVKGIFTPPQQPQMLPPNAAPPEAGPVPGNAGPAIAQLLGAVAPGGPGLPGAGGPVLGGPIPGIPGLTG